MTYIIPIAEETLALIQILNSGTPVLIQTEATCFVYHGENEHAEIMTEVSLREKYTDDELTTFTIGALKK